VKGAGISPLGLARSLDPSRYAITAVVPGAGPVEDGFRQASIDVIRVPMQHLSYAAALLGCDRPDPGGCLRLMMSIDDLYHIFDVLFSTSCSEGIRHIVAGTMATRRTVIANRCGEAEEIIRDRGIDSC
jgi:hypothetical protein